MRGAPSTWQEVTVAPVDASPVSGGQSVWHWATGTLRAPFGMALQKLAEPVKYCWTK